MPTFLGTTNYLKKDAELTMKVWKALNQHNPDENTNLACNAPYSKRNICIVKHTEQPQGWDNGEWVYLRTWCGRRLKHHPQWRNCIVKSTPNCLECLSA